MRRLLRALRRKRFSYETLVEIRISASDVLHNLSVFQRLKEGVSIVPVLKSNAYGHGLLPVASTLKSQDIPFVCVDSYFEALILRNEGYAMPILIIGYTSLENVLAGKLSETAFSVLSLAELRRLARHVRRPTSLHLEIDTGMRRHGLLPDEVEQALALIQAHPYLRLEGVFTHFADADTRDSPHAALQAERWNDVVARVRSLAPTVRHLHIGGTAAAAYLGRATATALRVGIGLYGFNTSTLKLDIRPALEMRSRITSLRLLRAGEPIGYNATFIALHNMQVASVAVGYHEGVERSLSNKGTFLVRGIACPIVGRVSMNLTSIDVSAVPGAAIDDEVIVISKDPAASNSLAAIARLTGVLPYELRVHIPAHLRRTVV